MSQEVDSTESAAPSEQASTRARNTSPVACVAGKVAFITGGSSGIGLGIARTFLKAGMKVIITYQTHGHFCNAMAVLNSEKECVHAIRLDVSDRDATMAAFQEAIRVFGKIHILVNNAGVAPLIPLTNASFDDWDWCMRVNVNGVFNCVRAALPYMKTHGEGGHIVTTSSMVGGLIVGPFWGVYSTSKFAVVGMMEALRSELNGFDIGVSVFCPASVESDIGRSERNRPAHLANVGKPDADQTRRIEAFRMAMTKAIIESGETQPMMDPLEAGEIVLRGILRNDLYILSHTEYEQPLRDRIEALMASIRGDGVTISASRLAMASIARNAIYSDEVKKIRNES